MPTVCWALTQPFCTGFPTHETERLTLPLVNVPGIIVWPSSLTLRQSSLFLLGPQTIPPSSPTQTPQTGTPVSHCISLKLGEGWAWNWGLF